MSVSFWDTHGAPHVQVGKAALHFPSSPTHYSGPDPVLMLLSNTSLNFGIHPVEVGRRAFLSRGAFDRVSIIGSKPVTKPYDGSSDYKRYGSFLDSALIAGRILSGGKPAGLDLGREHNVSHANLSGDIIANFDCVPILYHEDPLNPADLHLMAVMSSGTYNHNVVVPFFHGYTTNRYSAPRYNNMSGYNTFAGWEYYNPTYYLTSHPPMADLEVMLNYIPTDLDRTVNSSGTYSWGKRWTVSTSDFSWKKTDTNIIVDYVLTFWTEDGGSRYGVYHSTITIPYRLSYLEPDHFENGASGSVLFGFEYPTVEYTLLDVVPASWNQWPNPYEFTILGTDETFELLSRPGHAVGEGSLVTGVASFIKAKPWEVLRSRVLPFSSDIRYSAFQSTADALDTGTQSLRTDMWQTLLKLPEISDQLPDLKKAWNVVQGLFSGRPIQSLKDALDLATELRLTHQFEWRPEVDLFTNLVPKIGDVLGDIQRLTGSNAGEVVLRGNFSYDFPVNTFGFSNTQLNTHTRVAVEADGFRYLDDLLSLKATGFAPLISTGWDLTPFSFVANWFTGVGSRIRDIENVALVGVMGIKCLTHSYLVSVTLTDDEMKVYGLESAVTPGSKPLVLKFYVREVSLHVPPPRIGRFDFRMPTRLPDWATVGSLVWQVFLT